MKEYSLPDKERTYLRSLAERQAEYAALPVMKRRERMWLDVNTSSGAVRPPVVIETWTFDRDFLPESVYRCATETGRHIERQLLRNTRNHELIDDDKVIPSTFDIGPQVKIDEFGVEIPRKTLRDSEGVETAYMHIHPVKDIMTDLEMLSPVRCSVDREGTSAYRDFLEDLIGDLLPVKIRSGVGVVPFLTHRVIELMGMEAYFLAMYEAPGHLHRLMGYLRDNALSVMRWYESEGLLVVNNGNQDSFGTSYNFTDRLPAPGYEGGPARLRDMWLATNSQETVGISPEAFGEFCFPYYRDVCEPMGLLYYGCCEPAHPFWEYIEKLPHLKKVSISRWCDQQFMGNALADRGIVFSRKPDPNFLSVDKTLDEEGWAAHIRETLQAARNVPLEFIIRDVYTLHGDIGNAKRAIDGARREIDRVYAGS